MFYKFYDIDTNCFLVNIDLISCIYNSSHNSNLYHVVVCKLDSAIDILIDFEQFEIFERVLKQCNMN